MSLNRSSLSEAAERALDAGCRCVLLLGASDTGKTSFLEELLRRTPPGGPVSVVDADMGQSHVGPPTTIGWGMLGKGFDGWKSLPLKGLYFVGSTSPYRHLLPSLAGVALMHRSAITAPSRVFVDTPGFVHGPPARLLCWSMVDLLCPDLIIAMERRQELDELLVPLETVFRTSLLRCEAPRDIKEKTRAERIAYRQQQFASYFNRAKPRRLSLETVGLRLVAGYGEAALDGLVSRLVSLRDDNGSDAALGIVTQVDDGSRTVTVLTPLDEHIKARTVVAGDIRLRPDGSEILPPAGGAPES